MIKWVFLSTDIAVWGLLLSLCVYIRYVCRTPPLAVQWQRVFSRPMNVVCTVCLSVLIVITAIDSIHYRLPLTHQSLTHQSPTEATVQGRQPIAYSPNTISLLDSVLSHLKNGQEKTYSRPFASVQLIKETTVLPSNSPLGTDYSVRDYPPLAFAGKHLRLPEQRGEVDTTLFWQDIAVRCIRGTLMGGLISIVLTVLCLNILLVQHQMTLRDTKVFFNQSSVPWKTAAITLTVLCVCFSIIWQFSLAWHVLGTDRSGNDVLYIALKSIRTALVMGILTTLASLPFAVVLGILAGTMRGWVDTCIQYVYTVLSSIPGILLLIPCVLMVQVYIDKHLEYYPTALERADLKLFALCIVLGLTSWAGLARLLRAEAMKLRELDFVNAARTFGVPNWQIMWRHIMSNITHLLILTIAMQFSGLVLYEAVLSYIGIGVDPAIYSFGGMINSARMELARNPIIAWPILSAFMVMLCIVLTANRFADAIRDAFDPKYAVERT
jgi:peptide/nickel transport system permease protein